MRPKFWSRINSDQKFWSPIIIGDEVSATKILVANLVTDFQRPKFWSLITQFLVVDLLLFYFFIFYFILLREFKLVGRERGNGQYCYQESPYLSFWSFVLSLPSHVFFNSFFCLFHDSSQLMGLSFPLFL